MKNIIRKILKEETSRHLPQDHPLIKTIKKMVGNEYNDWFSDRFNEERYDYQITFHIPKITMWKVTDEDREYKGPWQSYRPHPDAIWGGSIYIKITKIKITDSEGRVDFLDINDFPDSSREDFEDFIINTVGKWIPGADLDVSIDF